MLVAVCLCVLALALPCWSYPSGHITTCEEFGRGFNFDPVSAVGEWFNAKNKGVHNNETEQFSISELTSSQLEQYEHMLRGYSTDKLKLVFKRRSYPAASEWDMVVVPQDDAGNINAWFTRRQMYSRNVPIPGPGPFRMKWKSVDGFLAMMLGCRTQNVFVMSKTTTPDEDKLQRVLDSLGIEDTTGNRTASYNLAISSHTR